MHKKIYHVVHVLLLICAGVHLTFAQSCDKEFDLEIDVIFDRSDLLWVSAPKWLQETTCCNRTN